MGLLILLLWTRKANKQTKQDNVNYHYHSWTTNFLNATDEVSDEQTGHFMVHNKRRPWIRNTSGVTKSLYFSHLGLRHSHFLRRNTVGASLSRFSASGTPVDPFMPKHGYLTVKCTSTLRHWQKWKNLYLR